MCLVVCVCDNLLAVHETEFSNIWCKHKYIVTIDKKMEAVRRVNDGEILCNVVLDFEGEIV